MSVANVVERFLFRDTLTYFIPGASFLLALLQLQSVEHAALRLRAVSEAIAGNGGVGVVFAALSYVLGYFTWMSIMILRKRLNLCSSPKMEEFPTEVTAALSRIYGEGFTRMSPQEVLSACIDVVFLRAPELYFAQIERAISFRNFRLSFSGSLIAWALVLGFNSIGMLRLWAVPIAAVATLIVVDAKTRDRSLDSAILRLFWSTIAQDLERDLTKERRPAAAPK